MNNLLEKSTWTSLELVEQINYFRKEFEVKAELKHKTLLDIIRDEFEEEIGGQKILPTSYKDSQGKERPMFILTSSQAKQVLVRESKAVRRAVIKYIEELENRLESVKQPYIRYYWNDEPIMLVDMLAKDLGVSSVTINKTLHNMELGTILVGNDLKKFKELNNYKSSCSLLRIIFYREAWEVAEKLGKRLSMYFLYAKDKFKLPLEQMYIALKQAEQLYRIGRDITDKKDRDVVLKHASTILTNIGLWDNKEDTDYNPHSLLGHTKMSIIESNRGNIKQELI